MILACTDGGRRARRGARRGEGRAENEKKEDYVLKAKPLIRVPPPKFEATLEYLHRLFLSDLPPQESFLMESFQDRTD